MKHCSKFFNLFLCNRDTNEPEFQDPSVEVPALPIKLIEELSNHSIECEDKNEPPDAASSEIIVLEIEQKEVVEIPIAEPKSPAPVILKGKHTKKSKVPFITLTAPEADNMQVVFEDSKKKSAKKSRRKSNSKKKGRKKVRKPELS